MQTIRRVNVSNSEELHPKFLHISFANARDQVRVSQQLYLAWTYFPPTKETSRTYLMDRTTFRMRDPGKVGSFVADAMDRTAEENAALPQNPDKDSVHTEWRDQVYVFWNHVFYDVANWLQERFTERSGLDGLGHFHPPSAEAFGMEYPVLDVNQALNKQWDQDALLIPAHLKPGVEVHLELATSDDTENDGVRTTFSFVSTPTTDVIYVRRGTTIKLVIKGSYDKSSKGTAAVMVRGVMCSESHDPDDPPGRPEQRPLTEREAEEAEMRAEAQSSVSNVFSLFMHSQAQRHAAEEQGRDTHSSPGNSEEA